MSTEAGEFQWPWLWLLTFASLVVLFLWAGLLVADVAAASVYLPDDLERRLERLPASVPVVALFAGLALASGALYADSRLRRALQSIPALALIALGSGPAVRWASGVDAIADPGEIAATVGNLALVLVALAAATLLLRKLRILGLPASVVNIASAVAARLIGLVLMGAVAVEWYPRLAAVFADAPGADSGSLALAFAATLAAPLVFGSLPARASLHREYRSRLESCFAVARGADGKAADRSGAPLSGMPPAAGKLRYPQLLICATANVRRRGPDGRLWTFGPFILSHQRCLDPEDDKATFETQKLECGRVPASLLKWDKEPLISLFAAVAATGAAVAPSMGRQTVPSARTLIAVANFRLGRWIPNAYSARARKAVDEIQSPGTFDKDHRLGSGYDELIPEMFGLYGPRVYLSDGGHYDNLGLLGLLRHEPSTIWCVDASPDPRGRARELWRVLELARHELELEFELDHDAFKRTDEGFYPATHVVAKIRYRGGADARLIVLKLGLTAASPLRGHRGSLGFPFHPTWRQVYDRDRMDRYRRLGQEVAERALAGDVAGT